MTDPAQPASTRSRLGIYLPLILFSALAVLFLFRLFAGDPQRLPSALIGKPAPATSLPAMPGLAAGGAAVPGIVGASRPGVVTVLNVFASWCIPCRDEHPVLVDMARTAKAANIRLVGLNYKDQPENARRFLTALGNPYAAIGADENGRVGIDWGVYGVPETYVIDKAGVIRFKQIGPVTQDVLEKTILPLIRELQK